MRRTCLLLACSLAIVGLTGCVAQGSGAPEGEVSFVTLDKGSSSGVEEERFVTVRDEASLEALFEEHAPEEDVPDVDFSEEMVLAAFQGESPDACHDIEIVHVEGNDEDVIAHVELTQGEDQVCAEVMTSPFHLVVAPAYDADIIFEQLDGDEA